VREIMAGQEVSNAGREDVFPSRLWVTIFKIKQYLYIFNLLRALVNFQHRHDTVKKGHALLSLKLSGLQARHAKAAKKIVKVGFERSSGPVYWHTCLTDYLVEKRNTASPRRGNDNTHWDTIHDAQLPNLRSRSCARRPIWTIHSQIHSQNPWREYLW
jgi:hypothetical protein